MQVDEPFGPRFELALDQLEAGGSFAFANCNLRVVDGALQVLVPTQWDPHSITRERALEELGRAERNLSRLVSVAPRFAGVVGGLRQVFILVCDYGMGGLWMCQKVTDTLEWYEGFPKKPSAA